MDAPSFSGLLIVVAMPFAVPFALGLVPRVKPPSVVLGIVIGPAVLGWMQIDEMISVIALVGLVFLLFLAGLEIEFEQLRGRVLKLAAQGCGSSSPPGRSPTSARSSCCRCWPSRSRA